MATNVLSVGLIQELGPRLQEPSGSNGVSRDRPMPVIV